MNRAERRAYAKRMKKMGANSSELIRLLDLQKTANLLKEGTKVKINYNKVTSDPDYKNKTQWFRDFVENNKDQIFTIEFDEKYKKVNSNILVTLKEDTSDPKWLWFVDDLEVQE